MLQKVNKKSTTFATAADQPSRLHYIMTMESYEQTPPAVQRGLSIEIDRQEFALALKTWRLRSALTQKQLAERWQTNRFAIIKAEGAKPLSWEIAYKLFAKLSKELRNESNV